MNFTLNNSKNMKFTLKNSKNLNVTRVFDKYSEPHLVPRAREMTLTAAAQANGNASKSVRPLAPNRSGGGASNALDSNKAEVTPEFLQAHLDSMRG